VSDQEKDNPTKQDERLAAVGLERLVGRSGSFRASWGETCKCIVRRIVKYSDGYEALIVDYHCEEAFVEGAQIDADAFTDDSPNTQIGNAAGKETQP
jgi:hypothetical protein